MESKGCLSVVMPVYNEEKSIVEIINRVLKQQEVGELIAVNDGSTDKTEQIVFDKYFILGIYLCH